ncbi:hypothetical protein JY446_20450 [Serratia marcescens]|nr:hypothetical protein [Serratia marcescens]HEJ7178775.1 hypothetical protein [Serratia marcescens]HEJ9047776.1 hypothetical protein [Serratia marcescens]
MGMVTFVVEYEDGKEPACGAGTEILGGKLVSVAWRDAVNEPLNLAMDILPPLNTTVLLFDANGEGWLLGWRSPWHLMGGKDTGAWQWSFQIDGLNHEDVNITHWLAIPDEPREDA